MKKIVALLSILSILLCSALASSGALGIGVKFNNNTDEDIVIHTAQYGGKPELHQQSDLTKTIKINKKSSKQIFLFETAPWLVWQAKNNQGVVIEKGSVSLGTKMGNVRDININPPVEKENAVKQEQ